VLKKLGFSPLISDPTIFYNPATKTFIITYINNCVLIRADLQYINKLKKDLYKAYPIENRGPIEFFLVV